MRTTERLGIDRHSTVWTRLSDWARRRRSLGDKNFADAPNDKADYQEIQQHRHEVADLESDGPDIDGRVLPRPLGATALTIGIMKSSTTAVTTLPAAAPSTTAIASARTFSRMMNALNSLHIVSAS